MKKDEKFIESAKEMVAFNVIANLGKAEKCPKFDVYVVWNAYILGNMKALLITTIPDGMYYEVTYNAATDEIYLDVYKKIENRKGTVRWN